MVVPTFGQSCSCQCGSYTYNPASNCSSAGSCAILCNANYGTCTNTNTYGCCGSSCTTYSATIKCTCLCSGSYGGQVYSVGTANPTQCTSSSCRLACSSTFPHTCGRYTNNAYCGDAIRQYQATSMIVILLNLSTFYFGSK